MVMAANCWLKSERRNSRSKVAVAISGVTGDKFQLHELTPLNPDALFGKPIDLADFENWLICQRSECAGESSGARSDDLLNKQGRPTMN